MLCYIGDGKDILQGNLVRSRICYVISVMARIYCRVMVQR